MESVFRLAISHWTDTEARVRYKNGSSPSTNVRFNEAEADQC